jgi:hypothetical protein
MMHDVPCALYGADNLFSDTWVCNQRYGQDVLEAFGIVMRGNKELYM